MCFLTKYINFKYKESKLLKFKNLPGRKINWENSSQLLDNFWVNPFHSGLCTYLIAFSVGMFCGKEGASTCRLPADFIQNQSAIKDVNYPLCMYLVCTYKYKYSSPHQRRTVAWNGQFCCTCAYFCCVQIKHQQSNL